MPGPFLFNQKNFWLSLPQGGLKPAVKEWDGTGARFGDGNGGKGDNTGSGIVTRTRPKPRSRSLYKVLLLNDDYTPMEFVVHIWRNSSPKAVRTL